MEPPGVFGIGAEQDLHAAGVLEQGPAHQVPRHRLPALQETWAASQDQAPILLDDADALLKETSVLNMLKGLFFISMRTVQWNSSTNRLKDDKGQTDPPGVHREGRQDRAYLE